MTWHKLLDTVAKKHGFELTIFDTHEIYRYSCAFWKKELDSDDLSLVTSGAVFRKKKDAYLDLVRIWLKDATISSLAEAQMKLVAHGDL